LYKKNDIFDFKIDKVAYGGKGLGKVSGKVFFVPGVLPGEHVQVKEQKEKESYSTSNLDKILEASPRRIDPDPRFEFIPDSKLLKPTPYSPGFTYYYTDYEYEVELKNEQFHNMIDRLSDADTSVCLDPIPSPNPTDYRNKIILHALLDEGEIKFGYYREGNQMVMDLPVCPLAHPEINKVLTELREDPHFVHTLKDGMSITIRYTENDGAMYWRNKPNKKDSWLKEKTILGDISVPKGCFFQVNPACCDILINTVSEMIDKIKPASVVDLYCGAGIFAIAAAARGVKNVVGIDCEDKSIVAAKYNASSRGFDNCRFVAGDAEKLTNQTLRNVDPENTVLIIDPPRNGLGRKARGAIKACGIKHIIYISCGPDTLMRDLKDLLRKGYELKSSQMVDMFPRTSHFETISYLTLA